MIPFYGADISPDGVATRLLKGKFVFVSYAYKSAIKHIEFAKGFGLDNGAYTAWTQGKKVDWFAYMDWVDELIISGFMFACIMDSIDGGEKENDKLLGIWCNRFKREIGAPVWQPHS